MHFVAHLSSCDEHCATAHASVSCEGPAIHANVALLLFVQVSHVYTSLQDVLVGLTNLLLTNKSTFIVYHLSHE